MPRVPALKDKAVRMPATMAVIYARYSSDNQREASIEDQLRECRKWAEDHNMVIVGEYCDRALSGRTDDRPQFQKMIADADKGMFEAVIMYQTSRFARNRYDAAMYKHRLKRAGVTLHYAAMSIPEGPEGIILEALMEGMDEYYSANLSKNIKRGQEGNALKGLAMNQAPLGLRINADQMYEPDPVTAPHVLRVYQMIDDGMMQKDCIEYLNSVGMRTIRGKPFSKSSMATVLSNRKYIGEYRYKDHVIPDKITPIVPLDLFTRVQAKLAVNQHVKGGHARAMHEFLLTGKLICGHCRAAMVGESGTSRNGCTHYYYSCMGRKRDRVCNKTPERQAALETAIVRETIQHVLEPEILSDLIDRAMEIYHQEVQEDPILRTLQAEKKTVDTSLRNLMRAIEDGLYTPTTKKRLQELEQQQADIDSRISAQTYSRPSLTREHIQFFLESFRSGDVNDPDYRRRVIETLVHSVTVTDLPSTDDDPTPRRRLQIVYNLTNNNTSHLDFSPDVFGCTPECTTIPRPSEHIKLYLSAGLCLLDVIVKVPE